MNLVPRRRAGLRLALLVVVLLVALPLADSSPWTAETIGSSVSSSEYWFNSLAFDPFTGQPAVAYYTYDLGGDLSAVKFTARETSGWGQPVVVDANYRSANYLSLAFDPHTGYPAIAYGGDNLRVAQWNGTAWAVTVVDLNVAPNHKLSLVFDSAGRASVAYCSRAAKGRNSALVLKHAWFNGAWHTETVDPGRLLDRKGLDVGPWSALAFDSLDRPTIAYLTGWQSGSYHKVKFATRQPTGWLIEDVNADYGAGEYVNLAYDPVGLPVIVDRAGRDSSSQVLRFMRRDGNSRSPWSVTHIPVDPPAVAAHPQLKFDPASGEARVMYQHGGNYHEVVIARLAFDGTFLGNDVVLPGTDRIDTYYDTSFAFDGSGRPAVAYQYRRWGDSLVYLKLARPSQ